MVSESKFETVDAYSIVDIDGAARLVGPVRSAKKALQRTTIDLVRHATYACAVHGLDASGAAAALNHDRAGEDQSPISSFAEELYAWADAHAFVASASLGLGTDELGDVLPPSAVQQAEATAASATACLAPGAELIAIASDVDEAALEAALNGRLVSIEPDLEAALGSGADAVFVRGKSGVLNHEILEGTNVKTIIGLQALTTTARGLAVASRAGAVVVPDFLSASGPILAALGHTVDDISKMTAEVASALANSGTDQFVAAAARAEDHLRTLTDTPPFGRPLAP